MKRFALLIAMLLSAPAIAQMSGDVVSPGGGSPSPMTFRTGTGSGVVIPDPLYFSATAPLFRYVNPTTGSDTTCDGKGSASAASGNPCAWASIQRAFDDVPDGSTANIGVSVAAGTFSGTNTWRLSSLRAAGSLTVYGDCSSPQATFSSNGTGSLITSAGSVLKTTQYLHTPTIATGTIPATIANGDFYYRQISATAASLAIPNVGRPVVASTTGGTTFISVDSTTTANTTGSPRLCPYATIFSGTTTIDAPANAGPLFHGMKFTGSVTATATGIAGGVWFTGTARFRNAATTMSGIYSTSGDFTIEAQDRTTALANAYFNGAVAPQIIGIPNSIAANVFAGTGVCKISFGIPPTTSTLSWAGTSLGNFNVNDFEGTASTAAICMRGPVQVAVRNRSDGDACSASSGSLEIVGAPLMLEDGATFMANCTAFTGKYTASSVVRSGAKIWFVDAPFNWLATNTSVAGQDWTVGAQTVVATAGLPVRDYGSDSMVSYYNTAAQGGPLVVPVAQGGTGAATLTGVVVGAGTAAFTATTAPTLTGVTVNGRITQAAGTPSSYTSGTCSSESGTGDDEHGTVTATCTAGQTVIVTFSATYTTAANCTISPTNAAASATTLGMAYGVGSATELTITVPTAATAGAWAYRCSK